jgi:hypothetical protein
MESDKDYINNTITIGTGLFELYLALQTIVRYIVIKTTWNTWYHKLIF